MKIKIFLYSFNARVLFILALTFILGNQFVFGQQSKPLIETLQPNQTIEREMARGETHSFRFNLKQNEFLQIQIEQKEIDVFIWLLNTKGETQKTMNSPTGMTGLETFSYIAKSKSMFTLKIKGYSNKTQKGKYIISRGNKRKATAKDKRRVEVENKFYEATKALVENKHELSIEKYSEAEVGWVELEEVYWVNLTRAVLFYKKAIVLVSKAIDKNTIQKYYPKAYENFKQSAFLYNRIGFDYGKGEALFGAVVVGVDLGKLEDSLKFAYTALPIFQKAKKQIVVKTILGTIGEIYLYFGDKYLRLGNFKEALKVLRKALPNLVKSNYKKQEANTRQNIGITLYYLTNHENALIFLKEALELRKNIGTKCEQAETLIHISLVESASGNKAKALKILTDKVLSSPDLETKCKILKETASQNLGVLYFELGESQLAINLLKNLLESFEKYKSVKISVLTNLGLAHYSLGKKQEELVFSESAKTNYKQALIYFNQALLLFDNSFQKETPTKPTDSVVPPSSEDKIKLLNNIAIVQISLRNHKKGIQILSEEALPLAKKSDSKKSEAIVKNNIGDTYFAQNEMDKAHDYFKQALALFLIVGDIYGESQTLSNMMKTSEFRNDADLAIFYGKLSIIKLNQIRLERSQLNIETQKSFLETIKNPYKNLAKLLIKENKNEQAIQIINFYRDQQFFDFNLEAVSNTNPISLSVQEQEFAYLYDTVSNKLKNTHLEINEFKRQLTEKAKTEKEKKQQLNNLENQIKIANVTFLNLLQTIERKLKKD